MRAPLHVEVAAALGWTDLVGHCKCASAAATHECERIWWGRPPRGLARPGPVPRFDLDWSATGPLLERFDISLQRRRAAGGGAAWIARSGAWSAVAGRGTSALESVCRLLLDLVGRRPDRLTDRRRGHERCACSATPT